MNIDFEAKRKAAIANLAGKGPLSQTEESKIHTWLAHIGETDEAIIAETIRQCQQYPRIKAYFLARAGGK
jgi:hypothetical protein